MLITQITENFYQVVDAFSEELHARLLSVFRTDRTSWLEIPDNKSMSTRLQYKPEINIIDYDNLCNDVRSELRPLSELAEAKLGKLYPNNLQLWYDPDGYMNTIHKGDVSPNNGVNVQIYLTDGNENMGTYCYDKILGTEVNKWHTIPYRCNCGYMMFHPTRVPHGMKHAVVSERISLYQSFRPTEIPSDIW